MFTFQKIAEMENLGDSPLCVMSISEMQKTQLMVLTVATSTDGNFVLIMHATSVHHLTDVEMVVVVGDVAGVLDHAATIVAVDVVVEAEDVDDRAVVPDRDPDQLTDVDPEVDPVIINATNAAAILVTKSEVDRAPETDPLLAHALDHDEENKMFLYYVRFKRRNKNKKKTYKQKPRLSDIFFSNLLPNLPRTIFLCLLMTSAC